MRVGSIVYATDQGLGILAKSFFDHGVVTDTVIIQHSRPNHPEWYPASDMVSLRSSSAKGVIQDFCRQMDVMLFFETPFVWELIPYCKAHGVKTVIMPMHECMPREIPPEHTPDLWLNPSHLDQQCFPNGVHIPVPVEVPWKLRKYAEVFVHNAGHGGLKGRNGTAQVLEAMKYVKTDLKLIVRSQETIKKVSHRNVEIRVGNFPYDEIWAEGDVFLFPEKFNGLSLPLQEAFASGMLVMCGDRFPMNEWLPPEPLLPVDQYRKGCVSARCRDYNEASFDPKQIARTMDDWYSRNIEEFSHMGKLWAERMSWSFLKPQYMRVIGELCESST